jgi:hypothetical protein
MLGMHDWEHVKSVHDRKFNGYIVTVGMPSTFRLGICDVTTSTAGAKIQFNIVVTVITIEFSSWPVLRSDDKWTGQRIQIGNAGHA